MNNPDLLRLLAVAHGSQPDLPSEWSWGNMSESMSYRLGLIAALLYGPVREGSSFLSRVSARMEGKGWTEDPWRATQQEMQEQQTARRLAGAVSLRSLMEATPEGRLRQHPEAASSLWTINDICAAGEHRHHGRLIHKALMPLWPGVIQALDNPSHPDRELAETFSSALTHATRGQLRRYAEAKFSLGPRKIQVAHERGKLVAVLEMLGHKYLSGNRLGAELLLETVVRSHPSRIDADMLAKCREALKLPASRDQAASSSSGSRRLDTSA